MRDFLEFVYHKNKKIFFFDIFDTIILRKVEPEYTKKIWSQRLSIQIGDNINYDKLYNIRRDIEASLCQINNDNGYDQEFSYQEMTNMLYNKLIDDDLLKSDYDYYTFETECKEIEIEVERSVQYVDPDWLHAVSELKSKGYKVYCVSDFYLNKEMLEELFEYHDILKHIDTIFVSSEYTLTKRSGRLYPVVLESLQCDKKDVVMVGDNKHSDYDVPLSMGIDAYLLNRDNQREFYDDFKVKYEDLKTYSNELDNIISRMKDDKNFVFQEIILSLFNYIQQLHKKLVSQKVKNVFFLAREGEYLLKLFNEYQERQGYKKAQHIKTHYIKVSRRATFAPSLKSLSEENFEILFRQYRNISINEFLSSINFSDADIQIINSELNIHGDNKEDDLPTSEVFKRLLSNQIFNKIYEENRVAQKELFVKYIEQFDADIKQEGFHLVDVGWKGTIQDNIYRIFDGKIDVDGYYLGLISPGAMSDNNRKQGLLFSSIPLKSEYYDIYNENRALYEIFLGASHGSANKYVQKNIIVEVETLQTDKEKQLFEEVILPLQNKLFDYFIELCDLFCNKHILAESFASDFSKIHARMVLFPTKREINFFNGLYHYENFGVFEYSTFNVSKNISFVTTFKNTIQMIRNPRGILNKGFWAPITLTNEGLGYLVKVYGLYKYRKNFKKVQIGGESRHATNVDGSNQLKELNSIIAERDAAIKKMTQMIDDRDAAIKSMTKMIDDRDAAIKNMTKMIDERDEIIDQLRK